MENTFNMSAMGNSVICSGKGIDYPLNTLIIEFLMFLSHWSGLTQRCFCPVNKVKGILNLLQKVNYLKMAVFLLQSFCISDLVFSLFS